MTQDSCPAAATLTDDDRRPLSDWAATCAVRVLPLFETLALSDLRPREAIECARSFADGGKRTAHVRAASWAAYAAARDVGDPAAAAAARSAGLAAATAYIHTVATPNQEKHALGPAVYAARACELAAPNDPAAADEALRWAVRHASAAVRRVVARLPERPPGRSRLDVLYHRLDADLRALRI